MTKHQLEQQVYQNTKFELNIQLEKN